MALTFRLLGAPLTFTQLDENFRTLQRNARVWDASQQYEEKDIVYYDGIFYEATSGVTIGVTPKTANSHWTSLPLDGSIIISNVNPNSENDGTEWIDTTSGIKYTRFGGTWVSFSATGLQYAKNFVINNNVNIDGGEINQPSDDNISYIDGGRI